MIQHKYTGLDHRKQNVEENVVDAIFHYDNDLCEIELKKCLKQQVHQGQALQLTFSSLFLILGRFILRYPYG